MNLLTIILRVDNLAITKGCKKTEKMTVTLAHGYSSESTERELSNQYHAWQGLDGFPKSLCPCALEESSLSIGRVKP